MYHLHTKSQVRDPDGSRVHVYIDDLSLDWPRRWHVKGCKLPLSGRVFPLTYVLLVVLYLRLYLWVLLVHSNGCFCSGIRDPRVWW